MQTGNGWMFSAFTAESRRQHAREFGHRRGEPARGRERTVALVILAALVVGWGVAALIG